MPSDSLPNWASTLFSAPPEMHGIHTQGLDDDVRPATYSVGALWPNLFTAARVSRPSLSTAAYFSWPRLKQLLPPESMNTTVVMPCQGCETCMKTEPGLTDAYIAELRRAAPRGAPSLSFYYLDMLDECGHVVGDESAAYQKAISLVDAQIARILHVLRQAGRLERTLIIVASDHGRQAAGYHHGGFTTSELAVQVRETGLLPTPRTVAHRTRPGDRPARTRTRTLTQSAVVAVACGWPGRPGGLKADMANLSDGFGTYPTPQPGLAGAGAILRPRRRGGIRGRHSRLARPQCLSR
jgi:hypothetical protein